MKRTVLAITLALAATALRAEPQSQRLSFAIMRNGVQIGQHDMEIATEGAATTVDFRTQIAVKVMFINAYSFGYAGRETWSGDRFISFQSQTNDNGKQHAVTETGLPLKIAVTDLGNEQIATRLGPRLAHHYRLAGGLDRDLWFDQTGVPLRYQLRGSDNSVITSEALP